MLWHNICVSPLLKYLWQAVVQGWITIICQIDYCAEHCSESLITFWINSPSFFISSEPLYSPVCRVPKQWRFLEHFVHLHHKKDFELEAYEVAPARVVVLGKCQHTPCLILSYYFMWESEATWCKNNSFGTFSYPVLKSFLFLLGFLQPSDSLRLHFP